MFSCWVAGAVSLNSNQVFMLMNAKWYYTEATEPSPQSSDMGGLNDFDNSKTAESLGSA